MKQILAWLVRAWAFVVRDFLETRSYRLAFFFQIYGIFFSIVPFYFIAQMFGQAPAMGLERYGGAYFPFAFVGITFLGFMTAGMSVFASFVRQGQMTGTLEAMLVTPSSLTTIVTASSLGTFVRSAINVVFYLGVGRVLGVGLQNANWFAAGLVLALSVAAFCGLGILSAGFVLAFKRGNPAAVLFGGISTLLSGVLFPVELLPSWARAISRFVPLTYSLEGMRRALLNGEGPAAISDDLLGLGAWTLVVFPLAVGSFRLAVRHAKREGSLAQY